MALISDLLKNVEYQFFGNEKIDIKQINTDSRLVAEGDLFVAIKGTQVDGHDYIGRAINSGAAAILCERKPDSLQDNVTYCVVKNTRTEIGTVLNNFHNHPTDSIHLVGITGTNGKTTVATICYQLVVELGLKAGLISTVHILIGEEAKEATHTTPDIVQLYALLSEMRDAGCTHVFMEVSSHALHQERVSGLRFRTGMFTNLTRDHLDYHETFDAYRDAKKILFDQLDKSDLAIICKDDRNASYMTQNCDSQVVTYGLQTMADVKGKLLSNTLEGMQLKINEKEALFQLTGRYNALNLLAAYSWAEQQNFSSEIILTALSKVKGAIGRFDKVYDPGTKKYGIVDYAHTPDALEKLLDNVKSMLRPSQKMITIVGCGGDRDKGKRPLMAAICAKNSHLCILTSDNPRSEEPGAILADMLAGVNEEMESKVFKIEDRKEAIKLGCTMAKSGDVIVVAGKGHEQYQEIKGTKIPFDDKEFLKTYLS